MPVIPSSHAGDLSRRGLRQLACYIRDSLDPIIAREGPDVMHPDDVLTLHEVFTALQRCDLSQNTLRATGIHRAVMEIAGKATRWPGRLADECDELIVIWRNEFGALENLRPFLYGRGGRLEGIADITDITRGDHLRRWQIKCPHMIAPERSHRHGDLEFKPGDWWLNALFAYQAGIIDLDTTEGGICYDSNGAYAVLLKDEDEIEGSTPDAFTYRCMKADLGRFRLTAADSKSRYPLRVLRSHSLNSIWAPRAGIRYEGLHRISGWIIRSCQQPRPVETTSRNQKFSELLFEIKFEREDQVCMDVVLRHPVSAELDDFNEFKRLRRLQRDHSKGIRRGITNLTLGSAIMIPRIQPAAAAPNLKPPLTAINSPAGALFSHASTLDRKSLPAAVSLQPHSSFPISTPKSGNIKPRSPPSVPQHLDYSMPLSINNVSSQKAMSTLGIPSIKHTRSGLQAAEDDRTAHFDLPNTPFSAYDVGTSKSKGRSSRDYNDTITDSAIREVAPWINFEVEGDKMVAAQTFPTQSADQSGNGANTSNGRSKETHTTPKFPGNYAIEDILPWIVYEPDPNPPLSQPQGQRSSLSPISTASNGNSRESPEQRSRTSQLSGGIKRGKSNIRKSTSVKSVKHSPTGSVSQRKKRKVHLKRVKSGDKHIVRLRDSDEDISHMLEVRHTMQPLARSGNPLAKLFDGSKDPFPKQTEGDNIPKDDYFTFRIADTGTSSRRPPSSLTPTNPGRDRASSSATARPLSPLPIYPRSPFSPISPCVQMTRRDAISIPSPPSDTVVSFTQGVTPLRALVQPITDEEWQHLLDAQFISGSPHFTDPFLDIPPLEIPDRPAGAFPSRPRMKSSSLPVTLQEFIVARASEGAEEDHMDDIDETSRAEAEAMALDLFVFGPQSQKRPRNAWQHGQLTSPLDPKARKVMFKDPFKESEGRELKGSGARKLEFRKRRMSSEGVEVLGPDEVPGGEMFEGKEVWVG